MVWGEILSGFTTGEDSVQPVSVSYESSWVDAVGSAVEEFLPSGFA